jgi:AraC-like DNA-binding protein
MTATLQRVPEGLWPAHTTLRLPDASVTWYVADPVPPPQRFLVTQPTLSFVRRGLKHLQPHGAASAEVVRAGTVVAMASGIHLMTELLGTHARYESVVVSVSPSLLRSLLGPGRDLGPRRSVATAPTPDRVLERLAQPLSSDDAPLRVREALLVAADAPPIRQLLYQEATHWGADDAERLRALMQTHLLSPLSLPEYAALAAMSLSTFKRRFRAVFDAAPGRWIHQARLQHARWMLMTEPTSVTDVCYASGFGDLSNFTRAFRRRFGLPPRAYRDAHAGLPADPPSP